MLDDVLTPSDAGYDDVLRAHYDGFIVEDPDALPTNAHDDVRRAFQTMLDDGEFTHDVLQAGQKVSRTFVRRVLLGERGCTYHYQRLRLFAQPWEGKEAYDVVRELNERLKERTRRMLATTSRHGESECDYNVTLINYMDTVEDSEVALKDETIFGLGVTSVSWHSDSSLRENSTVAVYHTYAAPQRRDWCVALRALNVECPVLRVPLEDRATYYMCGDFNATHHHAVLTGSSARFSSTHRVGVVAKDTFEYIKKRCIDALRLVPALEGDETLDAKNIQLLAEVHREVEFQWIRMFHLQGEDHARLHERYWRRKIDELTEAWDRMELCFRKILSKLKRSSSSKATPQPPRAYSMMLYAMKTVKELRDEHVKRCAASAYARLPPSCQPVDLPSYDDTSPLPFELKPVIAFIEEERDARRASN